MALFDEIRGTLSSVGKEGMNKAREWKDQAKVTMEIKSLQCMIEKKYTDIGRAYYRDHKGDKTAAYPQVKDIGEAFAKIQKLKKQQDAFRGIKRCVNCGGTIDTFANFCPCCGAKCEIEIPVEDIQEPKATPEAEDVFQDAKEVTEEAAGETAEKTAPVEEKSPAEETPTEVLSGEAADGAAAADAQDVEAE